jgi:hypothetical protein
MTVDGCGYSFCCDRAAEIVAVVVTDVAVFAVVVVTLTAAFSATVSPKMPAIRQCSAMWASILDATY